MEWQNDPPHHIRNHLSGQNNVIPDDLNSHQHQNDKLKSRENHVIKYSRLTFHTTFPLPIRH